MRSVVSNMGVGVVDPTISGEDIVPVRDGVTTTTEATAKCCCFTGCVGDSSPGTVWLIMRAQNQSQIDKQRTWRSLFLFIFVVFFGMGKIAFYRYKTMLNLYLEVYVCSGV